MNKFFVGLAAFVFTMAFGVLSSVVNGWALAKMWCWFVITAFPAVPAISPMQGIGLILASGPFLMGIFFGLEKIKKLVKGEEKETRTFLEQMGDSCGAILASILASLALVGIGYIWHQFI